MDKIPFGIRVLLSFASAFVVFLSASCTSTSTSVSTQRTRSSIESSYSKAGPFVTTSSTVKNGPVIYKLHYPRNYAALGFKSPIVVWGNGTDATTDMYSDLLARFASYGFTVVAPELLNTGSGRAMDTAARYMVSQNSATGSPFLGSLDVSHIAAVGHSQGAGGAVGAALKSATPITSVMTFSLPDKKWASKNPDCQNVADCIHNVALLKKPVFFISTKGFWDSVFPDGGIAPPSTQRGYYDSVKVHAAVGIIANSDGKTADHNSIQNANSKNKGNPGGFMGYATAWLDYQLRGDAKAAQAFSGATPELKANSNWSGTAVK